MFICHDHGPNRRATERATAVAAQKADNIHVGGGKIGENFITFRTQRDVQLAMPKLIIPTLLVSMRAGVVPINKDGNPMLKVPLNMI